MKQLLILLFVGLLFSQGKMLGDDITALNGKVYKNAEVISTMPDGILVEFTGKNGFNTVKLLKFKKLPAFIQKKYGYNPEDAKKYKKEHQQWLNEQPKKLNTEIKPTEDVPVKQQQQKKKLNGLVNSLDNISTNNNRSSVNKETSVNNLVHDAASSTESQLKEMNKLDK